MLKPRLERKMEQKLLLHFHRRRWFGFALCTVGRSVSDSEKADGKSLFSLGKSQFTVHFLLGFRAYCASVDSTERKCVSFEEVEERFSGLKERRGLSHPEKKDLSRG